VTTVNNDTDAADVDVTTAVEPESIEETAEQDTQRDSVVRRSVRGVRAKLGVILLAAALVASAGVATWLYFNQYRPDQETDAAAAKVALAAANTGTVALLSYAPDSLDKDFAAAKSHLTGDFLSYYTQFTEQIVTPAAQQKSVKTTAAIVRSAVSELHPDSAVVLAFINQNTISKENPDGAFAASSVKVGLKKVDGTWLISSFDPV
jgi:Mce-associated membrane protein